ncbi:MAG: hypothetical protein JHD15_07105 [Phenylobacterium sp.]|uniref:hypothetical protein n=1 Tax=Phenylobacterium sp. TaxID=1871053 RepID=UPI001A22D8E3|nr:hypothetical protein [Phenylobacterium sp.]MBJ7410121.1 hypothetical protein [Phenylobacterium sp.]
MSEWDDFSAPAEAAGDDWDSFSKVVTADKPKPKKRKRSLVEDVTGAMANVNRGLGIGDELAAAGGVVTGLLTGRHKLTDPVVPAFKAELAAQRGREDEFAAERPRAAAFARGTGNALTMAAPIGPGAQAFQGGSIAANALRGASLAGLSAAGYAAVDRGTLEERAGAAAEAARDPVTLGMGGAMGGLANMRPRARSERPPAPSLEELQTQRSAAYDTVANSGHTYSPDELQGLAQGIADDLGSVNLNPARHPRAASMLEDISGLAAEGEPITLTQLDQLRQVVRRDVASSTDDAEAFMGRRIIDQIDDFIDRAGGEGADTIRTARDLNTRVRKIQALDEAVDTARTRAGSTGTGSNVDNATRQNVRRFTERTRNLTQAEREAAERVVMGSSGQNALRQVGRLSPQGNGLMTALSIGGAAANPALAIPTAAGAVSKVVADAITTRNVNQLRELIARGGEPAARQIVNELEIAAANSPAVRELQAQLANDLAAAMGVQGASRQGAVEVYVPSRPELGVGVSR